MGTDDGSELLTSAEVAELLRAASAHAGGRLLSWRLDHVDATPGQSTTATYAAQVEWAGGVRDELFGVSARAGALKPNDGKAEIFDDGERAVAVWLHPHDPDLPGLVRAARPDLMAGLLSELGLLGRPVAPSEVQLTMVGYRPRRRAVVRVQVGQQVFFVKVLRESSVAEVIGRHELLLGAGIPVPPVLAVTPDHLVVMPELPGEPLATAMFGPQRPCAAEDLLALLDALPPAIVQLPPRPAWADGVEHYAQLVATAMPEQAPRLAWLSDAITSGLAARPVQVAEPTHGDFHEGQVHVAQGRIVGLLDVDTAGPGRRVDDLACLVAHLSTVQRMNAEQTAKVHGLIREWVPVFDQRVDPVELRLRAAGIIISLATGPFRSQEPHWQYSTLEIIDAAEALVRQVCNTSLGLSS